MNYTTLANTKGTEGSLKYWVNHEYLPVGEIITDAQNEIYSRLRVREMRKQANLAISIGTSALNLPTGFLDPISLKDQYKCDVTLLSADKLEDLRSFDNSGALISAPIGAYAIFGEQLQFDTQSSVAATFSFIYYEQPAALSGSNTTNFLTTRYSQLFRACLLKHAYAFRKA